MTTITAAGESTLARRDADELVAAREEQREADVFAALTQPRVAGEPPSPEAVAAWLRATPLGATPLAERIKELEHDLAAARSTYPAFDACVRERDTLRGELDQARRDHCDAEDDHDRAEVELVALLALIDTIRAVGVSVQLREGGDGYAVTNTRAAQAETERDTLKETARKHGAMMHEVMEERDAAHLAEDELRKMFRRAVDERDALRAQRDAAVEALAVVRRLQVVEMIEHIAKWGHPAQGGEQFPNRWYFEDRAPKLRAVLARGAP